MGAVGVLTDSWSASDVAWATFLSGTRPLEWSRAGDLYAGNMLDRKHILILFQLWMHRGGHLCGIPTPRISGDIFPFRCRLCILLILFLSVVFVADKMTPHFMRFKCAIHFDFIASLCCVQLTIIRLLQRRTVFSSISHLSFHFAWWQTCAISFYAKRFSCAYCTRSRCSTQLWSHWK